MCRHLAFLGPPVTLRALLVEPPWGLYRQAWAPRMQRHGTVNADGFGVGWYAPGDPVPARLRGGGPIWGDPSFADVARVTRSGAVLAAVRSATAGNAGGPGAAAPFAGGPDEPWLFSHNGALTDWGRSLDGPAGALPVAALLALEARCDSALLWGLVLHRLRGGAEPGEALTEVVREVAERVPGRMNLLLTDGRTVAATAWGDTLFVRRGWPPPAGPGPVGTVIASEPFDDAPGWEEVPDGSVVTAAAGDAPRVRPITATTVPVRNARPAGSGGGTAGAGRDGGGGGGAGRSGRRDGEDVSA
ncbi:ergothioneine biosynthesis protein EgtC [Allostreptomyces psammosilenae]|uniref:Gamma-glutamyl-hercynylcysteine sulfoxide hydrolase n=1 Tax=Allostreptomyces psammosilenae TaxID=1892865 RepID=A0A853A768_9ACTN|nr:ergothioneine biosynthesis protein EgtC [Allostreptomyces psammosilenae]NYI06388.1 glutamine amidotransferase [Allostreptomyces psammosilenae]